MYVSAIIVAAGISVRMKGENKLLALLAGKPVIVHTLERFVLCSGIDEIILVVNQKDMHIYQEICVFAGKEKSVRVIPGGDSRIASVRNGVRAVNKSAGFVAIHDGARPLVRVSKIDELIKKAQEKSAVIPVTRQKETVKYSCSSYIEKTIDRTGLYNAQTPQVFSLPLYLKGLENNRLPDEAVTDDSMLLERIGVPVYLLAGDEDNIKITTPVDLVVAEALLCKQMEEK